MAGNWTDSEIRELLSVRAEGEIDRQLSGTVRDAVVYDKITGILRERGIMRQKTQVLSKLKSLRKKFLHINDHHGKSRSGRLNWSYFDICQSIWGSSHSANPVALATSLDLDGETTTNAAVRPGSKNGEVESGEEDVPRGEDVPRTEGDMESAAESRPESPRQPPKKRAKKVSRTQQMAADMRQLFAEMDRDFHEKENLRIQEQRQYEERVRKEAMEHEQEAMEQEREARDRQMTMWREMQDSQNNLLRELMNRMPLPTPPQPVYSPLHQHQGSPSYHNTSYTTNRTQSSSAQRQHTPEQDLIFRPSSSSSFINLDN